MSKEELPWITLREVHEQGYARELDQYVLVEIQEARELWEIKNTDQWKVWNKSLEIREENLHLRKALEIVKNGTDLNLSIIAQRALKDKDD